MASTALSQSFFSTHNNLNNATPKSILKQSFVVSTSHSLKSQLKKTKNSSFITNCASPETDAANKSEIPIELRYPAYPTVMDINQIREILPHRFPFLLVDRVIEYNPGVSAVAIKNVTINDNFFPGHFPERPIMPGVLMVEAMAQVGGVVMLQPEVGGSRENFFFAGVDKVRFRKPVVAGDTLVMRMTLIKLQKRFGIAKMEGKAYVGEDVVCEVSTGSGAAPALSPTAVSPSGAPTTASGVNVVAPAPAPGSSGSTSLGRSFAPLALTLAAAFVSLY